MPRAVAAGGEGQVAAHQRRHHAHGERHRQRDHAAVGDDTERQQGAGAGQHNADDQGRLGDHEQADRQHEQRAGQADEQVSQHRRPWSAAGRRS
ncbi:hypothetical protein [Kutzneria kofuensis]|uniref:hypothetical protein n=1 Tax=Kutzneria kofuensis TaxID=103725 RepID=UPI0031E9DF51